VTAIGAAEQTTQACSRLELRIAIDYSARDAILSASRRAASLGSEMEQLTQQRFEELLGETRPVDVLIRTGGEQRLSDFLLWECAYAELVFTNRMWPDFDPADLARAVREFTHRERRFGTVPQAPEVVHDHWLR
jgi:undecaprenyl diphosphate synthase